LFRVAFVLKVRLREDTDKPTFIRLLPFCANSRHYKTCFI